MRFVFIFLLLFCANAEANRIDVVGGGGGSGSVSDTIYGAGWDGDTTVAPSKNAVYDKIETIASGGDNITVNTTAATNANFLDNLYIDWAIDTAAAPDDITSKFNYAETLAGNPALLTTECIYMGDGIMCEGTTADTIEMKLAFPDPATTDKTITLPNATDTLVGKDTTDTLTNKTMTAAANVIDADTAVALAADPADCGANTFATIIAASGALTCATPALGTDTSGNYVGTVADGTGIDGTAAGEGATYTPTFDATELEALTWGAGGNASNIWTFNLSGTDPTITFNSGAVAIGGALSATGAVTGSNLSGTNTGDNTVATSGDSATSFFSSGTLEVAIGGTGTTTSTGTGAVVLGTSPTFLTSIAIPQGATPTVDAAGETAVDTSDDQFIYYGGAKRVIPYERTVCFVIENLAAADDNYAFYMANDAITVTGVGCNCRGTCTTAATFTLEDRGGNAMTITGTNPTCATTGAATFAAVTAVNTLTAGEMAAFDVTNAVSPETDEYSLCITYTVDAQ